MEMEGRCIFQNKVFDPGAEICDDERCFVCTDGNWETKSAFLDYISIGP